MTPLLTILFIILIILCFWPMSYLLVMSVRHRGRLAKEREIFMVKSGVVALGSFLVISWIYGEMIGVFIFLAQVFLVFLLVLSRIFGHD